MSEDETINIQAEKREMLSHYSRALDEIYRLRQALAYEARVVERYLENELNRLDGRGLSRARWEDKEP